MLTLIWVAFLHNRIPGNWFLKGLIYGVIISFVAGALVSPLATLAGGDSVGLFLTHNAPFFINQVKTNIRQTINSRKFIQPLLGCKCF